MSVRVQTRVCVMRVQVDLARVLDHVGVIRKRDPETCYPLQASNSLPCQNISAKHYET